MSSFFPAVSDGQLIYSHVGIPCANPVPVLCTDGYPMALNPADGLIVWMNDDVHNRGRAPIVLKGQLLYDDVFAVGDGFSNGGVGSLNSADGSVQWISDEDTFYSLSVIVDGKAIRSSSEPTFVSR